MGWPWKLPKPLSALISYKKTVLRNILHYRENPKNLEIFFSSRLANIDKEIKSMFLSIGMKTLAPLS